MDDVFPNVQANPHNTNPDGAAGGSFPSLSSHCAYLGVVDDDAVPPVKPASQRSRRELVTAERMLQKLRGQLCGSGQPGPSRRAVMRLALDESTRRAVLSPADAAFDIALDRLLDELEREAEQPKPFDLAADANERATDAAFDESHDD